jgi:hypothetical protein
VFLAVLDDNLAHSHARKHGDDCQEKARPATGFSYFGRHADSEATDHWSTDDLNFRFGLSFGQKETAHGRFSALRARRTGLNSVDPGLEPASDWQCGDSASADVASPSGRSRF